MRRAEMIDEINRLGNVITNLNLQASTIEDRSDEIIYLNETISEKKKEIQDIDSKILGNKDKNDKLISNNEILEAENNKKKKEIIFLDEEISKKNEDNIKLNNKIQDKNISISNLSEKSDLIGKDISDKEKHLNGILTKIENKNQDLEILQSLETDLKNKINLENEDLINVTEKNSEKKKENKDLSDMNLELSSLNLSLEDSIKGKSMILEDLCKKIKIKEEEYENPLSEKAGEISRQDAILEEKRDYLKMVKSQLEFHSGKSINLII